MTKQRRMMGLVLTLLALWPAVSWADFVARVIKVHEGDRLTIYYNGRKETIYLKGIDCPELKQPYGQQARRATVAYLGNREVVIRALERSRQGRITAEVLLQDGRNIAHELLKEGLAWARKDTPGGEELANIEELVRAERKGLWSDPDPVPPWKWKDTKKAGGSYFN